MKILIRAIVSFFVFIVDVVYGNRPYPRFYLLETIAYVPYFLGHTASTIESFLVLERKITLDLLVLGLVLRLNSQKWLLRN